MGKDAAKLVVFKENVKEINEISEMAQKVLDEERNITISQASAIPTIVYEFMTAMFSYMGKEKSVDKDVMINLMHLFDFGITYRDSEDGEKDGNFTPFMNPGQICKTIIKSDEVTED